MMAQQSISIPSTYQNETDSIVATQDSITDSFDSFEHTETEQKKDAVIDAKIEYTSSDSMVIMGNGIAHMYGSGDLKYKSMELTADYIRVHMDSSTLYAKGVYDSIEDEWVGKPVFSEGNATLEEKDDFLIVKNRCFRHSSAALIVPKFKRGKTRVCLKLKEGSQDAFIVLYHKVIYENNGEIYAVSHILTSNEKYHKLRIYTNTKGKYVRLYGHILYLDKL